MENQSLTITKSNINCKFPANISLLAAANPIFGNWNLKKSVDVNVNLQPSLFSRFDIIWLLIDNRNKEYDKKLARQIASIHRNEYFEQACIDSKLLIKYVNFVKDIDVHLSKV